MEKDPKYGYTTKYNIPQQMPSSLGSSSGGSEENMTSTSAGAKAAGSTGTTPPKRRKTQAVVKPNKTMYNYTSWVQY